MDQHETQCSKPHDLKPSENSDCAFAWITAPTIDTSLLLVTKFASRLWMGSNYRAGHGGHAKGAIVTKGHFVVCNRDMPHWFHKSSLLCTFLNLEK